MTISDELQNGTVTFVALLRTKEILENLRRAEPGEERAWLKGREIPPYYVCSDGSLDPKYYMLFRGPNAANDALEYKMRWG